MKIIIVLFIGVAVLWVSTWQINNIQTKIDSYEECIMAEYDMTPEEVYKLAGEYPDCI